MVPALVAQFDNNDPSKIGDSNESELIACVTKRRTALRLLTELFVCGLYDDISVLQTCVSGLIKKDPLRKNGTVHNLLMLVSFVRRAATSILGVNREGEEKEELIVSEELSGKFCKVFDNYFEGVCEYLSEEFKKMKKAERWNKEQLKTKGVISEKGKEKYEERRAVFEKLLSNVQMLADALNKEMPKMVEDIKIDTIEEIGTEVVQVCLIRVFFSVVLCNLFSSS